MTFLHSGLATSSTLVLEAQMTFISTVFKASTESLPLAPFAASLLKVLQVALQSSRPHLRVLACGVLGTPSLKTLVTSNLEIDLFESARTLLRDEDVGVRSAACRLLGLLIKAPEYTQVQDTALSFCDSIGADLFLSRTAGYSAISRYWPIGAPSLNPSGRPRVGRWPTASTL